MSLIEKIDKHISIFNIVIFLSGFIPAGIAFLTGQSISQILWITSASIFIIALVLYTCYKFKNKFEEIYNIGEEDIDKLLSKKSKLFIFYLRKKINKAINIANEEKCIKALNILPKLKPITNLEKITQLLKDDNLPVYIRINAMEVLYKINKTQNIKLFCDIFLYDQEPQIIKSVCKFLSEDESSKVVKTILAGLCVHRQNHGIVRQIIESLNSIAEDYQNIPTEPLKDILMTYDQEEIQKRVVEIMEKIGGPGARTSLEYALGSGRFTEEKYPGTYQALSNALPKLM